MNDRPKNLRILAARVFDSISAILLVNQAITISRHTGLIVDVRPIAALDSDEDVIILDMREQNITLIPGLIDTHVHREPSFPDTYVLRWHNNASLFGSVPVPIRR